MCVCVCVCVYVCFNQKPLGGRQWRNLIGRNGMEFICVSPTASIKILLWPTEINPWASLKEKMLLLNPPGSSCGVSKKLITNNPKHNNFPHALYLILDKSRPMDLLWFSVLARGTVGNVQWASFGVALKCHPKGNCISHSAMSHHCSPLSACLPASGTDSFSPSTTLNSQPKRQISLCHPPTLYLSKAPQCLWDRSRMPVQPGVCPLLQLHLSPPIPHSGHTKDSAVPSLGLAPSSMCAQCTFSSGTLQPCGHTHTHPCSSVCRVIAPACRCIWLRRASPGPELTYTMAPAHHTGSAPLLTGLLTERKGRRTGTVSILLTTVSPAPSSICT